MLASIVGIQERELALGGAVSVENIREKTVFGMLKGVRLHGHLGRPMVMI